MSYRGMAASILGGAGVGDLIRVRKDGAIYDGVLMPRTELGDEEHIVLKLKNGYNIGISTSGAEVEVIQKGAPREIKRGAIIPADPTKPPVTILGTGGTIASRVDYRTGAVHPSFTAQELLTAVPELAGLANISTKAICNILSENMTPSHWTEIARACTDELNRGAMGVVIAHGTDTMAYTAAALSFMLQDLWKPVVLVGSQRSSDRPSSDAPLNLVSAVRVACSDMGEVTVVMHGSSSDDRCLVHRGTKVRKMHSSRRDAFRSINTLPLGEVTEGGVRALSEYRRRKDGVEVKVDARLEERVALLKISPGMGQELLERAVDTHRGIVLEGTGLGHVPEYLMEPIARAREEEKLVVMTTQTLYGRVDMKVYSTGRELLTRGGVSGGGMLPEVAYVKLMCALGRAKSYEEAKSLMETDLAGELGPSIGIESFLV